MQYVSTRGAAPMLGFADALLAGLARDGGLYAPRDAPPAGDPTTIRGAQRVCAYADAAVRVMTPFVAGDFGAARTRGDDRDAYAGFRHAATAPLVQIDVNLFALELFHGPTLAFKDFAMQWLGRAMNRVARRARPARDHPRRDVGRHRRRGHRSLCRPDRRPTSTFSIRMGACPRRSGAR